MTRAPCSRASSMMKSPCNASANQPASSAAPSSTSGSTTQRQRRHVAARSGHESVAAARDVAHQPVLAVAERAAHVGDGLRERTLADDDVGPHRGHQLVLADHLAGAAPEHKQQFERLPAQGHRLVVGTEKLAGGKVERAGAERQTARVCVLLRWRGQRGLRPPACRSGIWVRFERFMRTCRVPPPTVLPTSHRSWRGG